MESHCFIYTVCHVESPLFTAGNTLMKMWLSTALLSSRYTVCILELVWLWGPAVMYLDLAADSGPVWTSISPWQQSAMNRINTYFMAVAEEVYFSKMLDSWTNQHHHSWWYGNADSRVKITLGTAVSASASSTLDLSLLLVSNGNYIFSLILKDWQ